jgi:N-acetylmuramoyl-L-alanine amidase
MVQQQPHDAGVFQPAQILVALRNKLTGRNVKVEFTISIEDSIYKTNRFGNWNLNQHLQKIQNRQNESVEIQLHLTPADWDDTIWGGDDPSSWGEEIPENRMPKEMYRPVTVTVEMQNNNPQSIYASNSRNLAILNPESKPDQIGEDVWNAALNSISDARNPRILILLQPIWIKAQRFSSRSGTVQSPTLVVVHHTGGQHINSAIYHFTGENARSSAHYIIDRDGQIIKMVMNSKCAWHAGGRRGSYWGGKDHVNHFSIGIEIVHADGSDGNNPFTEEQYGALISLIRNLQRRYNIPRHRVVGHSDVAIPPSHNCPGPNFDWRRLEDEGLGLRPDLNLMISLNPDDFPIKCNSNNPLIKELINDLKEIGYHLPENPSDSEIATAINRFKRHFLAGSRRPRDVSWNRATNGDNVDFNVAQMIKAVRNYVAPLK